MLPLLLAAFAVKPSLDHPPAITGNCNPARVRFTGHISADLGDKGHITGSVG